MSRAETQDDTWRRCSACKKPIPLGATYYVCSVSTCNRARTALAFCDVSCWEVHLPVARHREAWAEEKTAPRTPEPPPGKPAASGAKPAPPRPPRRSIARSASDAGRKTGATGRDGAGGDDALPREVLIVASRLKDYVRARSGMNTSDRVLEPLSEIVRTICDEAIRNARQDGRKTLLDRDLPRRR